MIGEALTFVVLNGEFHLWRRISTIGRNKDKTAVEAPRRGDACIPPGPNGLCYTVISWP